MDRKFDQVGFIGSITETYETRKQHILNILNTSFPTSPPFTFQRLVEVLLTPELYTQCHKFMNSLEKLLSVTLLIDSESVVYYSGSGTSGSGSNGRGSMNGNGNGSI